MDKTKAEHHKVDSRRADVFGIGRGEDAVDEGFHKT